MTAAHVCHACGGNAAQLIAYPASAHHARPLVFTHIAICERCGLGVALPRAGQATLDEFYSSGAFWVAVGGNPSQRAHENSQSHLRVQHCAPLLEGRAPIAVLDVGAGHGWTADWAARAFGKRLARFDFIEPDDAKAAAILRKELGTRISRVASLTVVPTRYDLIFLNHVIEHVAEPVPIVSRVATLLNDGGIAYAEMPHSDYRFKDDVWPHTLFLTPRALAEVATRAGVRTLRCDAFGKWLPQKGESGYFVSKLAQKAFSYAAGAAPWSIQQALDRAIWRYAERPDGIWLRWIFRRDPVSV